MNIHLRKFRQLAIIIKGAELKDSAPFIMPKQALLMILTDLFAEVRMGQQAAL